MEWVVEAETLSDLINGRYSISTKRLIRCRDCQYRIVNENVGKPGYLKLKAMCELDTGDVFELGRNAWDDDWFCADAERRE